jgi:Zn-dependent metalloprotease
MKRLVALSLLATFSSTGVFAQESQPGIFQIFKQPGSELEVMRKAADFSKLKGMSALTLKESQFVPIGAVEQYGLKTSKAQYLYKGVSVIGGLTQIHRASDGTETFTSGVPLLNLDVTPAFDPVAAVSLAKSFFKNPSRINAKAELKILPDNRRTTGRLIYKVDVASTLQSPGAYVYLDAKTGSLIGNISKLETLAPTYIFSATKQGYVVNAITETVETIKYFGLLHTKEEVIKRCDVIDMSNDEKIELDAEDCKDLMAGVGERGSKTCQLVDWEDGSPLGFNLKNCTMVVAGDRILPGSNDTPALKAKSNVDQVLKYYMDRFKRNSYDGKGSPAVSATSIGYNFSNAAWYGGGMNLMVYGGGDGVETDDFTKLVDIAGHEMTHGVVEHTANLMGMGDSGALNEAIADFFGKMIAQDGHWLVGKGLFKKDPEAAIRDLATPGSMMTDYPNADGKKVIVQYPDHMNKKIPSFGACTEENDRCHVHDNSTIASHSLYLMHELIGKTKTEDMLYFSLTHIMNEKTGFEEFAAAMRKSCTDLKLDEKDCTDLNDVLVGVGL